MLDIVNLESLEPRAKERLDPMLFDYIAGGADDEWTLAENRAAWSRLQLLPRMLRGVANQAANRPADFDFLGAADARVDVLRHVAQLVAAQFAIGERVEIVTN